MERYQILLQHYKINKKSRTRYSFATRYEARAFAHGYAEGLKDTGCTGIYLYVLDTETGKDEAWS